MTPRHACVTLSAGRRGVELLDHVDCGRRLPLGDAFGEAMNEGQRVFQITRRRSACRYYVGVVLIITLAFGPGGCGMAIGYGIGHAIDGNHFKNLPAPYLESLAPETGHVVRVKMESGRTFTGELTGLDTRRDGEAVCLIETELRMALPGSRFRVDSLAIASIASAQVASGPTTGRAGGYWRALWWTWRSPSSSWQRFRV
jgi:hypothetical protein